VDAGFESRVRALDLTLFDPVISQTSREDKTSLLRCQAATRELNRHYCYLEIGSYLGGSILPHLRDSACAAIYSIDRRARRQPDSRGYTVKYPADSKERMLDGLRAAAPEGFQKLICIESDTRNLDPSRVARHPHLCFIDGEHTDEAVIADSKFCLQVMRGAEGALVFHDTLIVYNGLWTVLQDLSSEGRDFHAYNLPDILLVVEIGDFPLHRDPLIAPLLLNNWLGYLGSLRANDTYRRWANRSPIRFLRSVKASVRRTNRYR
jgi:hypothetical protein